VRNNPNIIFFPPLAIASFVDVADAAATVEISQPKKAGGNLTFESFHCTLIPFIEERSLPSVPLSYTVRTIIFGTVHLAAYWVGFHQGIRIRPEH